MTTVMLSWPPRAFARSTSLPAACAGGSELTIREDVRRLDEIAQAVGAEDERVAGDVRERLRSDVDLDVVVDPERAGDLVRVGVDRRLLGGEDLRVDHLLHHRVVARDLEDLPLVHQVHAAVADVRDLGPARVHQHGDDGRPGAAAAGSLTTRPRTRTFARRMASRRTSRGAVRERGLLEGFEDGRERGGRCLAPAVVPPMPSQTTASRPNGVSR